MHKSGFVNIIGRPNVGKSTLINALLGERMSIISHKPQTTRHRIIGIYNEPNVQIVFSDTPGIITDPSYKMQEAMNSFVHSTFEDADLMLLITEAGEPYPKDSSLLQRLTKLDKPVFLVINKTDTANPEQIAHMIAAWNKAQTFTEIIPISALHGQQLDLLLRLIKEQLPEGPPFYPKDQLTDKPERFFVSEIIREKILLLYHQEIPYSCEVVVDSFKELENTARPTLHIHATIYVIRQTQKGIIIGKKGEAIKRLGIAARNSIEQFLERKVFLELHVKVRTDWRNDERMLRNFGYS